MEGSPLLKTPPTNPQRDDKKTSPVELIYTFENNTASVMVRRDQHFLTES